MRVCVCVLFCTVIFTQVTKTKALLSIFISSLMGRDQYREESERLAIHLLPPLLHLFFPSLWCRDKALDRNSSPERAMEMRHNRREDFSHSRFHLQQTALLPWWWCLGGVFVTRYLASWKTLPPTCLSWHRCYVSTDNSAVSALTLWSGCRYSRW